MKTLYSRCSALFGHSFMIDNHDLGNIIGERKEPAKVVLDGKVKELAKCFLMHNLRDRMGDSALPRRWGGQV